MVSRDALTTTESFWKGKKVLVTGASGMVGSCLVKVLLALECDVVALIRDADPQSELYRNGDFQRISVVNGALEDFWTVERAVNEHEVNTVFHLGAQTIVGTAHRFPLATFEANIRGTYNLLEACRTHQDIVRRVVIASSDKAYGKQTLPYTEDMSLNGQYPYEVSKSCADLIARAYYQTYNLPVTIARCGNIYGEGDLNWSRIVPGTIRSFLLNEQPPIRSDGTYLRDYFYVRDAARAYICLAEHAHEDRIRGEAFNFSSGNPLNVLDMVSAIQRLMNCQHIKPRILNQTKGEIQDQYLATDKARTVLGWKSQFTLDQGLAETIEWYREFFN